MVVPVYNSEKYIITCLNSIERQTLDNIEVLIINDGSTDNSTEKIKAYTLRNPNFKLIDQKRNGTGSARNVGIRLAHGRYIYFLDADDYIKDDALEIMYDSAEANNLEVLLFSSYTFEDMSDEYSWNTKKGYKYNGKYEGVYTGMDLADKLVNNNDMKNCSCCMLFSKRDFLLKNNLSFLENTVYSEDSLLFIKLVSLSSRISVINIPLYYRRYRSSSSTDSINFEKKFHDNCLVLSDADNFLIKYPECSCSLIEWYLELFTYTALNCRNRISGFYHTGKTDRSLCNLIKPIIKSHNYFKSRRLFLFTHSTLLYDIYMAIHSFKSSDSCTSDTAG